MDDTDVLGYVQSRFPVVKRGDAYNVHVPCCFHDEDPHKRGRLYINIDSRADIPGLFHCKVCGEQGSLIRLKRHFGDPIGDDSKIEEDNETRRSIIEAACQYYVSKLAERNDALEWLDKRGFTMETIVKFRIGFADGGLYRHLRDCDFKVSEIAGTNLAVPNRDTQRLEDCIKDSITIPYIVSGNVQMIRGRAFTQEKIDDGEKYKTPPGYKSRLFNSDVTWGNKEIIVTEGEFDAMLLDQMGFAAVASPGANTWQNAWDGYVEDIKRLYVCFDPDKAGDEGAAKMRERFGARVKIIELPRDPITRSGKDLGDWLIADKHTVDDFRALMKDASGGGFLMTIDDCAAELDKLENQRGLRFNMAELDLLLRPGWLPGQVAVVLAKTGVGKTLYLLNMFQRMADEEGQRDLNFLFISLEQTGAEYLTRAQRIYQFYNPYDTIEQARDFWRPRILVTEKNRLGEKEVLQILDDYEYQVGKPPDVVALDYLGYWAGSFNGDRYTRTGDAIMSLKAIAKERKLRIVTPHQVGRNAQNGAEFDSDAARDSGVVEETADFLFTLWNPSHSIERQAKSAEERERDGQEGVVKLKIGKSRHGGRGEGIEFKFAPMSLALVPLETTPGYEPRLDSPSYRAVQERHWKAENKGIVFDEVLAEHRGLFEAQIRHEAERAALEPREEPF